MNFFFLNLFSVPIKSGSGASNDVSFFCLLHDQLSRTHKKPVLQLIKELFTPLIVSKGLFSGFAFIKLNKYSFFQLG